MQLNRRLMLTRMAMAIASGVMPPTLAIGRQEDPKQEETPLSYLKAVLAKFASLGGQTRPGDLEEMRRTRSRRMAKTILDRYTLAYIDLRSDQFGVASAGPAVRTLREQGWTQFLVHVTNHDRFAGALDVLSNTGTPGELSQSNEETHPTLRDTLYLAQKLEGLWIQPQVAGGEMLSGNSLEYLCIELFSRDAGTRASKLGFGMGSEKVDFRSFSRASIAADSREAFAVSFNSIPAHDVPVRVLDHDGVGCVASLVIMDRLGHVYPPRSMRIAPDMAFHDHIYRADGESLRLAHGQYEVTARRGPEYLQVKLPLTVLDTPTSLEIKLRRWIDPARWGWYSSDTHIHAGGGARYMHPTPGVAPETVIREVRGEALTVGDVLSYGSAFDYQRKFFSAVAMSPAAELEYPDLQVANNARLKPKITPKDADSMIRYDLEVSGFPSSHSGHPVLLGLESQDYPGTHVIEDWPSWNLPIMRWAKAQGAVAGYAHCSLGMNSATNELPNYEIPPFDGNGPNEAIIDVTHDACDFLSGCEGEPSAELNCWYHLLNCGYRLAFLGETDYPWMSDERPGVGRTYVNLPSRPVGNEGYQRWLRAIGGGRLYSGDGRSHFLGFALNGQIPGADPFRLERPSTVRITALVAAWLEPQPIPLVTSIRNEWIPWSIEYSRISSTRIVPIELIVNGQAVHEEHLVADGQVREVSFELSVNQSSWIALRILTSAHTHPASVLVDGQPIRASRRSARWLRTCVDKLWMVKHRSIRPSEIREAQSAYQHARNVYDELMASATAE